MIEGGPSRNYHNTKAFMYAEPKAWFALMDKLADMVITYLKAQINAGQKQFKFSILAGTVNVADYRVFIKPAMERILQKFARWMYR